MNPNLLLVILSLFTWGVGEGMFIYFQPLYLEYWGAPPLLIGAVLGANGVAMALAQAPAGYLADHWGNRPVMWISWITGTLSAIGMALAHNMNGFILSMLLYGLSSFVTAPMNSYITAVRGRWSNQRALTLASAMFHSGAVIGPLLGGFVGERFGLPTIYTCAAGFFVVSTLIILLIKKQEVVHSIEAGQRPVKLLHNPRFIAFLGIILAILFVTYLPQPLASNFLQNERGLSLESIGRLGAVASFGNAFFALVLGGMPAMIGLFIGQALVGLFALLMWQGDHFLVFALGYFFLGGYRLARSMLLALCRPMVNAAELGLAYGLIETMNAVAVILAPPVAGLLYNANPASIFATSAGLTVLALALSILVIPSLHASSQAALRAAQAKD
ncbi:MAG: MFS transporter [Chloroflexi bacterium]|nr:MFS transporter [Anaerolineaceae bacterium]NMB89325.1 MFS transporter [Chloroflexota bacterium]